MAFFTSSIILFTLSLFCVSDNVHTSIIKSKLRIVDPFAKEDVQRDFIKYAVILMRNEGAHCGGTIISDRFILTAAHCVINDDNDFEDIPVTVVAGTNTLNESDYENRIYRNVEEIIVPKGYVDANYGYDFALLKLSAAFDPDPRLKILSLPAADENHDNVRAVVSGYGAISVKYDYTNRKVTEQTFPTNLRYQYVRILPKTECRQIPGNMVGRLCGRLDSGLFTRRGLCYGDSGSGVVYDDKIIGVVSTAGTYDCDERAGGGPSTYADVGYFSDFIVAMMNGYRDPNYVRARLYNVDERS